LATISEDPEASLLLASPDPGLAQLQHDGLAQAYRSLGVEVHYVEPPVTPPPNQLFVADLFAMTPEGAILARPASTVRAGEERWAAAALAALGVPILRSIRGKGVFEGADLMWIHPGTALLAQGLRTNREGADQVRGILEEMGIRVVQTRLPEGTMHLMGQLRIVDRDLAVAWEGRLPEEAVQALEDEGVRVAFIPNPEEATRGFALNFVVLGPRRILMPDGNPQTLAFYEQLGIECWRVEVGEIGKAAGSIGCLTGILRRG
jgi:N-dimethylarginine dimethylaminohydrolase